MLKTGGEEKGYLANTDPNEDLAASREDGEFKNGSHLSYAAVGAVLGSKEAAVGAVRNVGRTALPYIPSTMARKNDIRAFCASKISNPLGVPYASPR